MDPPGIYIKFIEITKPKKNKRLIDLRDRLHDTKLSNWLKHLYFQLLSYSKLNINFISWETPLCIQVIVNLRSQFAILIIIESLL